MSATCTSKSIGSSSQLLTTAIARRAAPPKRGSIALPPWLGATVIAVRDADPTARDTLVVNRLGTHENAGMKTVNSIALLLVVGLAARAAAQHPHSPPLDTLYAGSVKFSASYMHNDSSESVVVAPDSTAPSGHRVVGRLTELRRVVSGPTPTLFRVNHFVGPTNDVTDSIMTAGTGLIPLWETSHQTTKLMHLKFDGRRVTGDVAHTGKPRETIDQTLAVPAFNSSDVFLVASALPLAPDYAALLATYEYESNGLRLDTLTVVGREAVKVGAASRDAWVVRISRGPSSWMTVWIDRETRDVLEQEFSSKARGWAMRFLRQPSVEPR
jgi:hypothetical protein